MVKVPARPHAGQVFAGVGALLVGVAVAGQSRINGALASALGGGLSGGSTAAAINMATGMVLITVLVLARPAPRAALAALPRLVRSGRLPWWQCIGGVAGATYVLAQATGVPVLGVAIFSVCTVGGQTASSLLVDRYGLGPAGRQPITGQRVSAAVLATLAVVIAVADQWSAASFSLALVLFVVLAGVLSAGQQGLNGRVSVAAGGPFVAGWVNFLISGAVLVIVVAVDRLLGHGVPALPSALWLYLGGPVGLLYIVAAAALVRVLGVLVLGLATVAGTVIGSMLLDWVAPVNGQGPSIWTACGATLTLVAVGVAVVRWPGRGQRRQQDLRRQ